VKVFPVSKNEGNNYPVRVKLHGGVTISFYNKDRAFRHKKGAVLKGHLPFLPLNPLIIYY